MSFERQEYGRARAWLRKAEDVVGDLARTALSRHACSCLGYLYLVEGNLTAAFQNCPAMEIFPIGRIESDLAATLHQFSRRGNAYRALEDAAAHETRALALWRKEFGDRHYYVMKAWISLYRSRRLVQMACGGEQRPERVEYRSDTRGSCELCSSY